MYKYFLGAIVAFSLLMTFFVVKYGVSPQTIKIIQPSNFETPERLAQVIYSQLFQKLHASKVIALGLEQSHTDFFDKTIEGLKSKMKSVDPSWSPEFQILSQQESFVRSHSPAIESLSKKDHVLVFSFVDLSKTKAGDHFENCEIKQDLKEWFQCSQQQKLREIFAAKRIDLAKPIAVMEQVGTFSFMIYFRSAL